MIGLLESLNSQRKTKSKTLIQPLPATCSGSNIYDITSSRYRIARPNLSISCLFLPSAEVEAFRLNMPEPVRHGNRHRHHARLISRVIVSRRRKSSASDVRKTREMMHPQVGAVIKCWGHLNLNMDVISNAQWRACVWISASPAYNSAPASPYCSYRHFGS
jgi:hypothetical protein